MTVPLPSVEVAYSSLMQEEAQRDILQTDKNDDTVMAMFGRSSQSRKYKSPVERNITCSACGIKGHSGDKCWTVVGYPKWHTRNSKPPSNHNRNKKPTSQQWPSGGQSNQRLAAAVKTEDLSASFTPQQLEQLTKLLNSQMQSANCCQSETDDELDHFSGMITCCQATSNSQDWIIDSGASDHMTSHISNLSQFKTAIALHINLPNGSQAAISHIGTVILPTGLKLQKVLCVPKFQHNLLSVQKLIKDSGCTVHFFNTHCLILDNMTDTLMGIGEAKNGSYYMVDHLSKDLPNAWFSALDKRFLCSNVVAVKSSNHDTLELWHNRLGHMPFLNMQNIP